jgi:hypothetical protein
MLIFSLKACVFDWSKQYTNTSIVTKAKTTTTTLAKHDSRQSLNKKLLLQRKIFLYKVSNTIKLFAAVTDLTWSLSSLSNINKIHRVESLQAGLQFVDEGGSDSH